MGKIIGVRKGPNFGILIFEFTWNHFIDTQTVGLAHLVTVENSTDVLG